SLSLSYLNLSFSNFKILAFLIICFGIKIPLFSEVLNTSFLNMFQSAPTTLFCGTRFFSQVKVICSLNVLSGSLLILVKAISSKLIFFKFSNTIISPKSATFKWCELTNLVLPLDNFCEVIVLNELLFRRKFIEPLRYQERCLGFLCFPFLSLVIFILRLYFSVSDIRPACSNLLRY